MSWIQSYILLYIEPKEDHISVLHYIVLALKADKSLFLSGSH